MRSGYLSRITNFSHLRWCFGKINFVCGVCVSLRPGIARMAMGNKNEELAIHKCAVRGTATIVAIRAVLWASPVERHPVVSSGKSRMMRIWLIRALLALIVVPLSFLSFEANASEPTCHPYNSAGYCQYRGKVVKAYVNAYDQLLLFFDTPVNPVNAAAVGLSGVSIANAAVYNMATNRDAGKAFFAAMLAAQARGATVEVQMLSVSNGYLAMDRIWVLE